MLFLMISSILVPKTGSGQILGSLLYMIHRGSISMDTENVSVSSFSIKYFLKIDCYQYHRDDNKFLFRDVARAGSSQSGCRPSIAVCDRVITVKWSIAIDCLPRQNSF